MLLRLAALATALVSPLLVAASILHTIDLASDASWTLSAASSPASSFQVRDVAARVPGDVYTALQEAQIIGDPYAGMNLQDQRWVAAANWTFRGTVPAAVAGLFCAGVVNTGAAAVLRIGGLETASAVVTVNGITVANANTLFVPVMQDVAGSACDQNLDEGVTVPIVIEISFVATTTVAKARADAFAANHGGTVPDAPAYPHGLPFRNLVRTTQASFGWDWGPAVAANSIRGPVLLEAVAVCRPYDVLVTAALTSCRGLNPQAALADGDNEFAVTVNVTFRLPVACMATAAALTSVDFGPGVDVAPASAAAVRVDLRSNNAYSVRGELVVSNVALWWPRGLGEPTLHPLNAVITTYGDDGFVVTKTDLPTHPFGFRCVALITTLGNLPQSAATLPPVGEPDDTPVMGLTVNGALIFAQGANIVPSELLSGRVAPMSARERLDRIVVDAVAMELNMLRVWGGGEYLPDSFYAACDAAGLLVWQEAMFACAEYPTDAAFVATVRAELEYQVRRLSRFASVALWSGNNEDGEVYDKGPASPYQRLNTDVVLTTIAELDPARPLWPSSPSPGFASGVMANGLPVGGGVPLVTLPPEDGATMGDTHFYNYSACASSASDDDALAKQLGHVRFASEYGYEAMPSAGEWYVAMGPTASNASERGLLTKFADFRQRHAGGNPEMLALMKGVVPVPPCVQDQTPHGGLSWSAMRAQSLLSQAQQALCMADETRHYRRGALRLPLGGAPTLGALFWQLNSVWPAPSWASTDYSGARRLLHHALAGVFDGVTLRRANRSLVDIYVPHLGSTVAMIHVPVTVTLVCEDTNAVTAVETRIDTVLPVAGGSQTLDLAAALEATGCGEGVSSPHWTAAARLGERGSPVASTSAVAAPSWKQLYSPSMVEDSWQRCAVCNVTVSAVSLDTVCFDVTCDGQSHFIRLERRERAQYLPRGVFGHNGFTVTGARDVAQVIFTVDPGAQLQPPPQGVWGLLTADLHIMSLCDASATSACE